MLYFPNNTGVSGSASNPSKSTQELGLKWVPCLEFVPHSCHFDFRLSAFPGGSNCARTRGTPAGFSQEDEAMVQAAWDIPAKATAGENAVTETVRATVETGEEYGYPTN